MENKIALSGNPRGILHVIRLHAVGTDIDQTIDRPVSQQESSSDAAAGVDELAHAMEALGRDSGFCSAQYTNYPETYTVTPGISEILADFLNHFTSEEQVKFLISTGRGPSSLIQSQLLVGLPPGQQARFLSLHENDRKILLMPAIGDGYKQQAIRDFVQGGTTKGLVRGW